MAHRTGPWALALLRLLVFSPGDAVAAPHTATASLSVTREDNATGCPGEAEMRRDVTALLGYSPFQDAARRQVAARLWATEGTFHARVQLLDVRTRNVLGARELAAAGPTCEGLASAMALAIALAIDPLAEPPPPAAPGAAVAAPPPAPPPPVPKSTVDSAVATAAAARAATAAAAALASLRAAAEAPRVAAPDAGAPEAMAAASADAGAEPPEVSAAPDGGVSEEALVPLPASVAPAPEAAPAGTKKLQGIAGAGADVTLGLVPATAFAVVVHGGVAFGVASLELEARWLPATDVYFYPGHISSTLVTGALVGCATFGDWGACGVFQAGPLTSSGRGYAQSFTSTTWAVAVGVRGQWDWVFANPVGLRLHADGLVNLVHTRIRVGTDIAWDAPSVALSAGAGFFVVF